MSLAIIGEVQRERLQ